MINVRMWPPNMPLHCPDFFLVLPLKSVSVSKVTLDLDKNYNIEMITKIDVYLAAVDMH